MTRGFAFSLALVGLVIFQVAPTASAKELKVLSEQTATGFGHIESIAYDPNAKVLYTGDFGPDLKPADKDGKGKITKVSLDGKILEDRFLPAEGQTLNKPKGIWVKGNRLWVTDIDAVWVFDLKTKKGKKLDLPGITFAMHSMSATTAPTNWCALNRPISSTAKPTPRSRCCSRTRESIRTESIRARAARL